MTQRMDLWQAGNIQALVDDTEAEALAHVGSNPEPTKEMQVQAFNTCVLSGRLCSAVCTLTNRDGGGVLCPDDLCTKTGCPVLEVLQEKHPKLQDAPILEGEDHSGVFETYEGGTLAVVRITIT